MAGDRGGDRRLTPASQYRGGAKSHSPYCTRLGYPADATLEGPRTRIDLSAVKNVEHYRRLLETVTDQAEREHILKLLAQERQKRQHRH